MWSAAWRCDFGEPLWPFDEQMLTFRVCEELEMEAAEVGRTVSGRVASGRPDGLDAVAFSVRYEALMGGDGHSIWAPFSTVHTCDANTVNFFIPSRRSALDRAVHSFYPKYSLSNFVLENDKDNLNGSLH